MKFNANLEFIINLMKDLNHKFSRHEYRFTLLFFCAFSVFFCSAEAVEKSDLIEVDSEISKNYEDVDTKLISSSKNSEQYFSNLLYADKKGKYLMNDNEKKTSIFVFFQNDCQACHKMMIESKCLKKDKNIENYFIGIHSSSEQMVKSVSQYIGKDKILYSESDLVKELEIEVTPTVFIFKNSKLIRRIDNYASCRELM